MGRVKGMLIEYKDVLPIPKQEYSLYKLLEEYNICIPAIQRDYVQGLDEVSIKAKD